MRALLEQLLPVAAEDRAARLRALCADDPELRAEVAALMELDEGLPEERGAQRPPLGWLLEPGGDAAP